MSRGNKRALSAILATILFGISVLLARTVPASEHKHHEAKLEKLIWAKGSNVPSPNKEHILINMSGEHTVVWLKDTGEWIVNDTQSDRHIKEDLFWASVLPSGEPIIVPKDYSMHLAKDDGTLVSLLPPGNVAGQVVSNSDGTLLAVTTGFDLVPYDLVGSQGLGVYDLRNNTLKPLVTERGYYLINLGWLGDKILFHRICKEPGVTLELVDMDGNITKYAKFGAPDWVLSNPWRSPDGRYVATHHTLDEIIILDLKTKNTRVIKDVKAFTWSKDNMLISPGGPDGQVRFLKPE